MKYFAFVLALILAVPAGSASQITFDDLIPARVAVIAAHDNADAALLVALRDRLSASPRYILAPKISGRSDHPIWVLVLTTRTSYRADGTAFVDFAHVAICYLDPSDGDLRYRTSWAGLSRPGDLATDYILAALDAIVAEVF
jgi:hypothetical protein